jgi:transposase
MSDDRISELMAHLIGHRVNESTVYSLQKRLYEGLHDFEEKSIQHLRGSEVIHNDETGISIEGKRKWLHVACTEELTHYAVDDKRGKEATDRIGILSHFHGRSIHDGWKAYFQYPCRHGLCHAHHLRELVFFEEEEKAPWAVPLKDLLLFAKTSVETAKNEGKDHLDPEPLHHIGRLYREILEKALADIPPPARTGRRGRVKKTKQQNLIERLLRHEESVLAFAHDFAVPFDNNQAERDVRMMKLKQKISGTFRSLQGAQYFARIRGYISTVRKNGRNVFEEIGNALSGKPFYLEGW